MFFFCLERIARARTASGISRPQTSRASRYGWLKLLSGSQVRLVLEMRWNKWLTTFMGESKTFHKHCYASIHLNMEPLSTQQHDHFIYGFAKKLAAKVCRPNQTSHLPLESSWLIDSLENEARQVQIGRVPKVSQKSQWRENVFLSQLWQRSCMIIPQENYGIDHQLSRSNMAKPNLSPSIADRERERAWHLVLHPPFNQVAWDPRKQGKLCERCGLSSAAWVAPRWWVPHGRPGRGGWSSRMSTRWITMKHQQSWSMFETNTSAESRQKQCGNGMNMDESSFPQSPTIGMTAPVVKELSFMIPSWKSVELTPEFEPGTCRALLVSTSIEPAVKSKGIGFDERVSWMPMAWLFKGNRLWII